MCLESFAFFVGFIFVHIYKRPFVWYEFHKELAAHLKVRHQDLIVHCEKGSIYRSLTVRPEVIADYHFVLGYDF